MNDWKALYRFPLRSREGEVAVFVTADVCREDMETLAKVIAVGLDEPGCWPTLEEAQTYWRCGSCEWSGPQRDLIPREGHGRSGCPQCGGATAPLRALPGQPPESVLTATLPSDKREDDE